MITSGRVLYKFLLAFTETSFNSVVGMLSGWLPFLLSCAWACVASDMNNQIKMLGLSDNKRLLFIVKIFEKFRSLWTSGVGVIPMLRAVR